MICKLVATLIPFILLAGQLQAQLLIDLESGLAFQTYNNVRIPNEGGTLFSYQDDFELQGPVIPFRARLGYTFSEKNHLILLYAPLGVNYEGRAAFDIQFEDEVFRQGVLTDGYYQFNSYRLTYRRDFVTTDQWTVGAGLTAKIRDASVRLENEEGVQSRNDDVGFVPLLHLHIAYHFSPFSLYLEGDGLASDSGRAFDYFLGAAVPISEAFAIKGGYRILEGGANVSEVYNFAMFQYGIIGLLITP